MIPTNPIPEVPNYGSSAIYKDLPSPEQIRAGVIPLDSLPAAWWNALWACTNTAVNDARSAVGTLITEVCNAITGAGICINPSCVDQLYQAIETIRQRIGNAAVAGAVKSSPNCGEVSIDANGIMTANGVGNAALLNTSSKVIVNAINELKSTYDCCFTDLSSCIGSVDNSKAPTSHASSATTYGVGNADCYGHVKISDEYTCCVGAAADGIAASQLAVYCVYQAVQSAAGLGNTAGCALGTASAGTCNSAARSDHVHPKPSRSDLGLGSAADRGVYTLSAVGTLGYDTAANRTKVPDIAGLAYWNGAYQGTSSNLRYYCGGAFGTAAACAASAFRSCTWTPSCVDSAGALMSGFSSGCYVVQMTTAGSSFICVTGCCLGVGSSSARPVRVGYADCASKDGSGCAFGTAARYACGCFRPSTWTPSSVLCANCIAFLNSLCVCSKCVCLSCSCCYIYHICAKSAASTARVMGAPLVGCTCCCYELVQKLVSGRIFDTNMRYVGSYCISCNCSGGSYCCFSYSVAAITVW